MLFTNVNDLPIKRLFRQYHILDTDNTHISNINNGFDNILLLTYACFWNTQIFASQTPTTFLFSFMCHHWNLEYWNYITIPSLEEA